MVPFDIVLVTSSESKEEQTKQGEKILIRLTFLKAFHSLTICDKMLRHMEGDLDGKRARVLCCIDDGNDTRADGNQGQCDLVQWTVEVAWGKEQRERGKSSGVKVCFIWDLCQAPTD